MKFDHDSYLDAELANAPKYLSNDLFHYTNADAALNGILANGTLRLSPFNSTNDLWESRPLYPNLSGHYDDQNFDNGIDLWKELDRHIRQHAKVTCLTQDLNMPDYRSNPDALKGWSHLSLWAHYGDGHAGVCLRFDKGSLVSSFEREKSANSRRFHGQVRYLSASTGLNPHGIDLGQVREFGVDAVAVDYAIDNKESIFFKKHIDWANESEYRLVALEQTPEPAYFDIRESLTGVIIGDSFSDIHLAELLAILEERYPHVDLLKSTFHNRKLWCFPYEHHQTSSKPKESSTFCSPPNRREDFNTRLNELRAARRKSAELQQEAKLLTSQHTAVIQNCVTELRLEILSWGNIDASVHPRVTAVPVHQRSRAAGVPGEVVHFETGYMCVGENLPPQSHSIVAAAAIQVLDNEIVRLHSVIEIEHWEAGGNTREEAWRTVKELPASEALQTIESFVTQLKVAVAKARRQFDAARIEEG